MKSAEPTKVLAIDDDPDICFYIQEILERNNCIVTLTEKGRDALQLLATQSFDVVMTDVRLPDLDGVSILEHMRLSGSEIPFVLITGFSENEPIISSIRLGAVDYLTKPFSPSELEKALGRAIDQKKRLAWSRRLYEISEHQDYTLHEKIQRILLLTGDILDMDFGFVVRSNPDGQALTFCSGQTETELDQIAVAYEKHVEPKLAGLLQTMAAYFHEADPKAPAGTDLSWVAMPLRTNQQTYGVVCFSKEGPRLSGKQESERSILQLTEFSLSRLLESEENAVIIANQQSLILAAQNLSNLGSMATSIVHEIENHLTIIAGRTVMVEKLLHTESKSSNTKIKVALDSIGSDVKRIDRIVKSVRTIAHTGPSNRAMQMLQISSVVEEALELFRCKIKSRPIRLTVAEIPTQLFLLGDPTQLLQVFLILLNNSFDAIEDMPEEWIHVGAEIVEQSLHLSVTDSGLGIPPHLYERIFTPFFTTKNAGKGLGVGLSLARKYVEAHEGSLWIDPHSSNTCFVVQLIHLMDQDSRPATFV